MSELFCVKVQTRPNKNVKRLQLKNSSKKIHSKKKVNLIKKSDEILHLSLTLTTRFYRRITKRMIYVHTVCHVEKFDILTVSKSPQSCVYFHFCISASMVLSWTSQSNGLAITKSCKQQKATKIIKFMGKKKNLCQAKHLYFSFLCDLCRHLLLKKINK